MRSIAVLGDVRVHHLLGSEDLPKKRSLNGGAYLMHDAIRVALEVSHPLTTPEIYSYDFSEEILEEEDEGEEGMVNWNVRRRPFLQTDPSRFRLNNPVYAGKVIPPSLSQAFAECLAGQRYEGGARQPDVVVVDDLGLGFGKLQVKPITDSSYEFQDRHRNARAAVKAVLKKIRDLESRIEKFKESDESVPGPDKAELKRLRREFAEKSHDRQTLSLGRLLAHLDSSTAELETEGRAFPAEPILVFSLAGKEIPELKVEPVSADTPRTVWQHAHQSPPLRRRSIVIFDAETLRNEICISKGLSWERTAQDTLVEFQRSKKLRPFLRFGYLMIRYGRTGLLMISNSPYKVSSATLYFSPDHDEERLTNPNQNGYMLGETSILVATIVERLAAQCRWRHGAAVYQDIHPTLEQASLLSINRMVDQYGFGFGIDKDEFNHVAERFPERAFGTHWQLIHRCICPGDEKPPNWTVKNLLPQRVAITAIKSRQESILSQSCQVDFNQIAYDIGQLGAKAVLNTLEDPIRDVVRCLVHRTVVAIKETDSQFSLFVPDDIKTGDDLISILCDELGKLIHGKNPNKPNYDLRLIIGEPTFKLLRQFLTELKDAEEGPKLIRHIRNSLSDSLGELREQLNVLSSNPNEHIRSQASGMLCVLQEQRSERVGESEFNWHYIECVSHEHRDSLRDIDQDALRIIESKELFRPSELLGRILVGVLATRGPAHGLIPSVSTPVLYLGTPPLDGSPDKRLLVVDRNEVEGIHAIQRLVEEYLKDASDEKVEIQRPLSIAVFGPPGSGKSVAVKNVVKMMSGLGVEAKTHTINLSQLENVAELKQRLKALNPTTKQNESESLKNAPRAFRAIRSVMQATKVKVQPPTEKVHQEIPVIFFDEFDSTLKEEPLGWLKYFLSIMEDGDPIEKAVYVFAGGTSESFEAFSLADRSRNDPDWIKFAQSKGPDFISRLVGHLNVMGVNPSHPDDDLYVIRRAIILRYLLAAKQNLVDNDEAKIDENMINAFLHVPEYIHGARSMRILIDLCYDNLTEWVSMSKMPPIHQLNMHVDGKAFVALASGQNAPTLD